MRYMTLLELLDELRAEAGISQNVAHGVTLVEPHKALLRRIQEELYLAYHWPHLNTTQTVTIAPGARYHEYPDQMVFESISRAYQRPIDNTQWTELGYGIEAEHLNLVDSDSGAQQAPVRRWQNYLSPAAETMANNMFEVWPVPDQETVVRFTGRRKLFPLTGDDDKTTIDGPLIALHGAAELLARQKAEDAALKLQKAGERRRFLGLRQSGSDTRRANLAGALTGPRPRPGIEYR